jgi:uncharacterized protein
MPASSRAPRLGPAFAFIAVFLLVAGAAKAAEPDFPALTGRVVDAAGILSPSVRDALTQMLARQQASTGEQVVVVTLKSLQGYTIEEYGYQLGRHWGIGQKGQNNGAVLIVAPNERKARIEVGYGLEARLTDALSRTIIDQQMLPHFRQGDYSSGTLEGTAAILRALGGGPATVPLQVLGSDPATAAAPLRSSDIMTGLVLLMAVSAFFFIPSFIIFATLRSKRGHGSSGESDGSLGESSSSGGGSSGADSFSGGGGDFGGGGASDSW